MLAYDEKRNYIRMPVDCDMTFKQANSMDIHRGRCKSISGAGLSFITDRQIDLGQALEITVAPRHLTPTSMTAFIKVLRITRQIGNHYEIAATIQSIKGC